MLWENKYPKNEPNLYGLETPKKHIFAKVFSIYRIWTFLKMSIFETSPKLFEKTKIAKITK
jgi:hypothetical protein